MKQCRTCKEYLELSQYGNNKKAFDGLKSQCKLCTTIEENIYRKTKKGLISTMIATQRRNSKARGHSEPELNTQEYFLWLKDDFVFNIIFDIWTISGHKRNLTPSIDRIDNSKGYEVSNIQITTLGLNLYKNSSNNEVIKHKKINNTNINSIIATHIESKIEEKFISGYYASKVLKLDRRAIHKVLKRGYGRVGSYNFRYISIL